MADDIHSKQDNSPESSNLSNIDIQNFDLTDLSQLLSMIEFQDEKVSKTNISNHLKKIIEPLLNENEVLFLYKDDGSINHQDADKIYNSLPPTGEKNILLILHSNGGQIEPAYLISKLCKEKSNKKFIVSIPRRAKSAATLISLGADEIHMGALSEIGPIDPQIKDENGSYSPTLSLSSALECIANLCQKYPSSSNMFAGYLAKTLPIRSLGLYERVSESAQHYAARLLENTGLLDPSETEKIAKRLVYEYKDHSFVIDKDEAQKIFGTDIVKINTQEYSIGNQIHDFMQLLGIVLHWKKKSKCDLVGLVTEIDFCLI